MQWVEVCHVLLEGRVSFAPTMFVIIWAVLIRDLTMNNTQIKSSHSFLILEDQTYILSWPCAAQKPFTFTVPLCVCTSTPNRRAEWSFAIWSSRISRTWLICFDAPFVSEISDLKYKVIFIFLWCLFRTHSICVLKRVIV